MAQSTDPTPPNRRQSSPWNKVVNALVELLKVRSIITIISFSVMSYMAVIGTLDPATFMTVVGCIVTYYFTRKER